MQNILPSCSIIRNLGFCNFPLTEAYPKVMREKEKLLKLVVHQLYVQLVSCKYINFKLAKADTIARMKYVRKGFKETDTQTDINKENRQSPVFC